MTEMIEYFDRAPLRFGLSKKEIRTKVHDTYNICPLRIMSTDTFVNETLALLEDARNPKDFYEELSKRRETRLAGFNHTFERMGPRCQQLAEPFGPDESVLKRVLAGLIFSTRNFDALIEFFDLCLPKREGITCTEPNTASTEQQQQQQQQRAPQYVAPPARLFGPDEVPHDAELEDTPRSPMMNASDAFNIPWDQSHLRSQPAHPPEPQQPPQSSASRRSKRLTHKKARDSRAVPKPNTGLATIDPTAKKRKTKKATTK